VHPEKFLRIGPGSRHRKSHVPPYCVVICGMFVSGSERRTVCAKAKNRFRLKIMVWVVAVTIGWYSADALISYTFSRSNVQPTRQLQRLTTTNLTFSVYPRHLLDEEISPPPKKTYNPPNGWQIVYSKSFFRRGKELQIYHGNSLLMDNKHRKLFVTKQSKGCRFMPKMHQNTLGGRASRGPARRQAVNRPILAAGWRSVDLRLPVGRFQSFGKP